MDDTIGLGRTELEYELRWMMRRAPKEPEKAIQFLGEVLISLIEKNNAAVAKQLAERDRADLPEGD